jgi:hypothetical protein
MSKDVKVIERQEPGPVTTGSAVSQLLVPRNKLSAYVAQQCGRCNGQSVVRPRGIGVRRAEATAFVAPAAANGQS